MATETEIPALEVRPNEFDGWDVKHQGTADAISNHADKASAVEAANKIAEHEDGEVAVEVHEEKDETVSDEARGVKFYFVVLLGLLVAITLIIVIVSLVGGLTEFGADDANKGEGVVLTPLL